MIRNVNQIDDDIIRKKRIVAQMLYSDSDIVEVLDNKDIDPDCPDELLYENIFPFIRIPGAQDTSKSYITYMLDDMEQNQYNKSMKNQYLNVVIFVHKDLIKTPWGAERHDLLSYIVKDIFHQSNVLGMQCNLLSNREGTTDNNFCTRTLKFEIVTPNSKPFKTNPYEAKSILGRQDKIIQHESVGGDSI